jgi:hypothetical protein
MRTTYFYRGILLVSQMANRVRVGQDVRLSFLVRILTSGKSKLP